MQRVLNMRAGKAVVATLLLCALALTLFPHVARADETGATDEVRNAYSELTSLSEAAEQSGYDVISIATLLDDTNARIADLDVQISQSQNDLDAAKKDLAAIVSESYKHGNVSLLDLIISSASFDDFISRLFYANKIVEHEKETIARVDALSADLASQKTALEQEKCDLEQMLEEQTRREEEARRTSAEVQQFLDQIPSEVLAEVMAYDASLRAEDAAASQEILDQLQQADVPTPAAPATDGGSAADSVYVPASSDGSAAASSASSTPADTTPSGGYSSEMLARAYELLGSGYQWSGYSWTGDTSSSSFTCSGVVDYALGRDSQSSSPESLYEEVGSNLTNDVSSFQEGDLVFYSYGGRDVGHVGVYVGDGYVIDSIPNGGVALREVDYMDVVGGGSIG